MREECAYESVCRESGTDDDDFGGRDERAVSCEIFRGKSHVEVVSAISQLAQESSGFRTAL